LQDLSRSGDPVSELQNLQNVEMIKNYPIVKQVTKGTKKPDIVKCLDAGNSLQSYFSKCS